MFIHIDVYVFSSPLCPLLSLRFITNIIVLLRCYDRDGFIFLNNRDGHHNHRTYFANVLEPLITSNFNLHWLWTDFTEEKGGNKTKWCEKKQQKVEMGGENYEIKMGQFQESFWNFMLKKNNGRIIIIIDSNFNLDTPPINSIQSAFISY